MCGIRASCSIGVTMSEMNVFLTDALAQVREVLSAACEGLLVKRIEKNRTNRLMSSKDIFVKTDAKLWYEVMETVESEVFNEIYCKVIMKDTLLRPAFFAYTKSRGLEVKEEDFTREEETKSESEEEVVEEVEEEVEEEREEYNTPTQLVAHQPQHLEPVNTNPAKESVAQQGTKTPLPTNNRGPQRGIPSPTDYTHIDDSFYLNDYDNNILLTLHNLDTPIQEGLVKDWRGALLNIRALNNGNASDVLYFKNEGVVIKAVSALHTGRDWSPMRHEKGGVAVSGTMPKKVVTLDGVSVITSNLFYFRTESNAYTSDQISLINSILATQGAPVALVKNLDGPLMVHFAISGKRIIAPKGLVGVYKTTNGDGSWWLDIAGTPMTEVTKEGDFVKEVSFVCLANTDYPIFPESLEIARKREHLDEGVQEDDFDEELDDTLDSPFEVGTKASKYFDKWSKIFNNITSTGPKDGVEAVKEAKLASEKRDATWKGAATQEGISKISVEKDPSTSLAAPFKAALEARKTKET